MTSTICNPLDLAYRFQAISVVGQPVRTVHREAADPSIVRYRDRYYLFASMSRGFWHSSDLVDWSYRGTEKLPAFDYAPDVREIDGALVISASRNDAPCPFFRSEDPLADDFTEITPGSFDFWDPNLFQDRDGRTYLYWGCSSTTPLRGAEIDPKTFELIGETVDLLTADVERRGWEQGGEDYRKGRRFFFGHDVTETVGWDPFIEGAWLTQLGDRYYLQYAAPATEFNTYADGYVTGPTPLGPFEYSTDSPFSSKPGGFISGAGHGSTFQDTFGNWWHASTMRISINHTFERRIGLFPAGFDEDGVLFCNQNFADYPMSVPAGRFDPWQSSPGWMLLSYKTASAASSQLPEHPSELALNEDVRTWWVAGTTAPGEWLSTDLGAEQTVHAIQINLADHDVASVAPIREDGQERGHFFRTIDPDDHPTELVLEVSLDGEAWSVVADTTGTGEERPHGFFVLDEPALARFVRITAGDLPYGAAFAVSGLRVFGHGAGTAPSAATATAERVDDRTAAVHWKAVEGALGYNVRYGSHPEKLYHSWLVYEQTELEIGSLNAGVDYWVAVDAFSENGVTTGATVVTERAA